MRKALLLAGGGLILFGAILSYGNGMSYEVLATLAVGVGYLIIEAGTALTHRLGRQR